MKVTDTQLRAAMDAVRAQGLPVTGARVRLEVRRRYHVSAGTSRLYRLLAEPPPVRPAEIEALHAQLAGAQQAVAAAQQHVTAATQRAELAEFRERSHQEHWARDIDALRQKYRSDIERVAKPGLAAERELALRRQLLAALRRIAELESG